MNQQTDSTDKNQLPGLSQGEDEIKASLERIQKQVDDLDKLAQQAEMQQSEELKRFSESVQETDAGENMEQMSNALNRQNREKAGEQGEMALSKLQETLDDMQQQLAKMTSDEEEDIERAMRAALEDANQLSKMQEELRETAADVSPLSIMLREMATSQQELMSACKGLKHRISELGKMSPFVASGLQDLVDGATSHMEMASRGFDSKKSGQALKEQREAMTNLNMAAIRLMESIQQQSNCKSGGSCDNKIKKLQSLCNKQKQLNQQTQGQCQKPGGQGNPQFDQEGRQTLQRLAGEQATIRKSMEDLAREFGNSRQILGRLDGLAEEMKRVEEDLASGETGEKTLERQLQIHSRMLEATRSLQRRDFTEQRKAESATSDAFYIPPELSSDILEDGTKLEDRLRQYLSGQYPPQYEEQIKAYFRALLQARPVNRDNSSGESTRP